MSLIVLSIPIFFLLIGIELLIVKMRHLSYYRFNDAVTNLSCGIGSQITGIFLKTVTFAGYLYLYKHSPLLGKIPTTWWVWVVLFVGVDFFYYWFHRLAHEISILWGSHVVHHQSEEYNLTVALRQAWLQGAFSWVFYLPLAVAGFPPEMFVTVASLQTLYQFWIHTKLIHKMHPWFEYVFATPSHHRVHHGVNPKYIDRNHGGTLIIFDRLFGTFQEEEEEVVYGITSQPMSWNPVWVNFEYWIDLFKDVFAVHNFADKIKMLVLAPGWKPAEIGGTATYKEVTPQTFKKYDTDISSGLNYYILFQFAVLLGGTSAFLNMQMKAPFLDNLVLKAAVSALIILSLLIIGGLFEKRKWAMLLEFSRILLAGLLCYWVTKDLTDTSIIMCVILVYGMVSEIWFLRFRKEF